MALTFWKVNNRTYQQGPLPPSPPSPVEPPSYKGALPSEGLSWSLPSGPPSSDGGLLPRGNSFLRVTQGHLFQCLHATRTRHHTTRRQGKPRQAKASQGKPRQAKASQGKPRQAKASQGKPRQARAQGRAQAQGQGQGDTATANVTRHHTTPHHNTSSGGGFHVTCLQCVRSEPTNRVDDTVFKRVLGENT